MASLLIADDHPLFRAALRQAARDALGDVELLEAGDLDGVRDNLLALTWLTLASCWVACLLPLTEMAG